MLTWHYHTEGMLILIKENLINRKPFQQHMTGIFILNGFMLTVRLETTILGHMLRDIQGTSDFAALKNLFVRHYLNINHQRINEKRSLCLMISQDIEIFTLFLLIAGYKERVQRNIYFSINTRTYFEKN